MQTPISLDRECVEVPLRAFLVPPATKNVSGLHPSLYTPIGGCQAKSSLPSLAPTAEQSVVHWPLQNHNAAGPRREWEIGPGSCLTNPSNAETLTVCFVLLAGSKGPYTLPVQASPLPGAGKNTVAQAGMPALLNRARGRRAW